MTPQPRNARPEGFLPPIAGPVPLSVNELLEGSDGGDVLRQVPPASHGGDDGGSPAEAERSERPSRREAAAVVDEAMRARRDDERDGGVSDLPEVAPEHVGEYRWKNGWEMVWECSDDWPHPTHADYETPPGDRPDWCYACRGPCKDDEHG